MIRTDCASGPTKQISEGKMRRVATSDDLPLTFPHTLLRSVSRTSVVGVRKSFMVTDLVSGF